MILRGSGIVTAFVTAIVTLIVTAAASPVSAEVLTVCGISSDGTLAANRNGAAPSLASPLQRLGGRIDPKTDSLIALWHDQTGFDILIDWGSAGQHSLRSDGAEIIGMSPSLDLVHLVVAHEGSLEHFLFSLDEEGRGELLRSAADEQSSTAETGSRNSVCVKPH